MNERRQGILAAIISNVMWGFLPLYWHALRPIESSVLIFYRLVLSAIVCWFLARRKYTREELTAPLKDRKLFLKLLAAGVLITLNWSLYIWAVNADHSIETAIGYYIEPVVVCLFGVLIFHDKLNKWKAWAFAIAAAGVAVIVLYYRSLPLISLGLALSFSLYGAMKKGLNQPALLSFFYETVLLSPFALIVLIWLETTGRGAFAMAVSPWQFAVLALCGFVTAIPLILFGESANKAGLFATGLIGYLSPTITLFLSIFVFHEPFDLVQLAAFAIIWVGLGFFTYGELKE